MKRILFCILVLLLLASAMPLLVASVGAETSYPINNTDSAGREVTIEMEPRDIIVLNGDAAEAVKVLGKGNNVVGVVEDIRTKKSYYFPGLVDTESVGTWKEFDYEKIAELAGTAPTLVITYVLKLEPVDKFKGFENITVVAFDFYKHDTLREEVMKLGEILNATDNATIYNTWYQTKESEVINSVVRLEPISRDALADAILSYLEGTYLGNTVEHSELNRLRRDARFHCYGPRPWVFIEAREKGLGDIASKGPGSADDITCTMAGGRNIASDLGKKYPHVDWEWVLEQNPDVIINGVYTKGWGWRGIDEPEGLVEEIKSRPGAENISAVRDNRVYAFCNEPLYGMDSVVGLTYWAKLIHPELDLDPEGVYMEYLTNFMGLSYPEGKIFVYPGYET
jgi:iron complex transport system substrate-binding protein